MNDTENECFTMRPSNETLFLMFKRVCPGLSINTWMGLHADDVDLVGIFF